MDELATHLKACFDEGKDGDIHVGEQMTLIAQPEDPVAAIDVVAKALQESKVYITHDDGEELGRIARLAVWQRDLDKHWFLVISDYPLLYLKGDGQDKWCK